jgi:hypothetical protein
MCAFFDAQKVAVGNPSLPRIPPQLHHIFTIVCTLKSPKPQQKTTSTMSK